MREEASRNAQEGAPPAGLLTRRKLRNGEALVIASALGYVPRRRGARHYQDTLSQALSFAKLSPHHGEQLAHDLAPEVAALLPAECDLIACPPASRSRGWYFARELASAVARIAGVPLARPLRWAHKGEQAKTIRHQGGHGRKLGFVAECLEDLRGQRVAVVDDLVTSGLTMAAVVECLVEAGAEVVAAVTLARTERTEDRPAGERALVAVKGQLREAKRRARRAVEKGAEADPRR